VRLGSYMMDIGRYVLDHATEWSLPLYLAHGTADRICQFEGSAQFAAHAGAKVTFHPWEGAVSRDAQRTQQGGSDSNDA